MIVAMYDITGIQDFVFSSKRLLENLGASSILQSLFEDFFSQQEKNGECSIIYIGGGNAMIEYADETKAKDITKKLSRRFVEETGGMLRFAVSIQKLNDSSSFVDIRKNLMADLNRKKSQLSGTVPLLGIAITQDCESDGWPAVEWDDEKKRWLSYPAMKKLDAGKQEYYRKRKELLPKDSPFRFPVELDHLGKKQEESGYIAIVHIDGNSMGSQIKEVLKTCDDFNDAKTVMSKLSNDIENTYFSAMKKLVALICERTEKGERYIPIRPIILSGDDVTFACRGDIGLWLAEQFLLSLPELIPAGNGKLKISACAGVAIVKSHFPFHRAYDLAEQLCSSAKKKAKAINIENPGSWIDYHIIQSGISSELGCMRESHYNVKGMKMPDPLTGLSPNGIKYTQYNMLWRPWCVKGACEEVYKWENLKSIMKAFDKWPNNRMKELRNCLIGTRDRIDLLLSEIESREIKLPGFAEMDMKNLYYTDQTGTESHMTPYFDAIEALDFYEDFGGK